MFDGKIEDLRFPMRSLSIKVGAEYKVAYTDIEW